MKKRAVLIPLIAVSLVLAACFAAWIWLLTAFPRPYRETVERSGMSSLVYAVIRAESSFQEDAVSSAGAVGLMQIKPATAEFICRREGILFQPERLKEGEYNIFLGTRYLLYLMERFKNTETALAAYNAGEGTVAKWLRDREMSSDGMTLGKIPYPETATYVKKVGKFKKIYEFLYR